MKVKYIIDFLILILYINKNNIKSIIIMAVPKKRTSKSKKNARKANWKRKGYKAAQKSLSLAKSMLRGKTTSFVYSLDIEDE